MRGWKAPEAWAPLLARHAALFEDLDEGEGIAIAARDEVAAPGASMLVLARLGGRTVAQMRPFPGYAQAGIGVMLVGDAHALAEIEAALEGDGLPAIKKLVRRGHLVCYVLKRRCELVEAGFEDLLDSLGVAFMGACR